MTRIDAHQHYWHPARGDYGWIPKDDPVLSRPYGPADLAPCLDRNGIAKTVLVQAAPTIGETEYLLGIADATNSVAAVVGWIDFEKPDHLRHLQRWAGHLKFKGVRPAIQDIPDDDWMQRDDVQWAFEAVADLGLTFDALGLPRHLAKFLAILQRYPSMRAVIDHCMKPRIRDRSGRPETYRHWADGMTRLARETETYCKLSGLVTETGGDWSVENLRPWVDHVLAEFGPERVMWGSDWPVCTQQATYDAWFEAAQALTDNLSAEQKSRVFGGTAAEFYRL
jgi:L-fuconolactonase